VEFLLADHPPVERPLLRFAPQASAAKMAVTRNDGFARRGRLLVALVGPLPDVGGFAELPHLNRVVMIDPATGTMETLFGKKPPIDLLRFMAETHGLSAGPRRPVDVVFSPDGEALYVVDYGGYAMTEHGLRPVANTGVIWKITSLGKRAELPVRRPNRQGQVEAGGSVVANAGFRQQRQLGVIP
jgi:hypothetical protein